MSLEVLSAGPSLTIQDGGRPGHLQIGLSRGGAMDRRALAEGAALLGQSAGCAALEMAGMGGVFEATEPLRIALTGAPMRASLNGQPLRWSASHALPPGARLEIGPALAGTYGYLHLGGGIDTAPVLGARAAHLNAGLGQVIKAGDTLPAGADPGGETGLVLDPQDRFSGGALRLLPTAQTGDFPEETRARLAATDFTRDPRSNRMIVRLAADGPGFALDGGLTVLSEITQAGDIQITGDGTPVILMAEAQTAGGYPRIGAILPADLPRAAQAPPNAPLRLTWIGLDAALEAERRDAAEIAALPRAVRPLVRRPEDIADLLGYTLIDGATTGHEDP